MAFTPCDPGGLSTPPSAAVGCGCAKEILGLVAAGSDRSFSNISTASRPTCPLDRQCAGSFSARCKTTIHPAQQGDEPCNNARNRDRHPWTLRIEIMVSNARYHGKMSRYKARLPSLTICCDGDQKSTPLSLNDSVLPRPKPTIHRPSQPVPAHQPSQCRPLAPRPAKLPLRNQQIPRAHGPPSRTVVPATPINARPCHPPRTGRKVPGSRSPAPMSRRPRCFCGGLTRPGGARQLCRSGCCLSEYPC
ncbi:hypothetical protein QBC47DRAFT_391894 [Echria macrotheca]|uniref:Uncharacterized protein n=1 Tax=Echria macrotheca TaxID=438768 RepID=A0AAJ0F1Q3_9PEZI|nr:hypothetical protein QBC47DRAFT_391894 [Echria macrotheca]